MTTKEIITLTIGDCAENHVRNQQIGSTLSPGEGFQRTDLETIRTKAESKGIHTELVTLPFPAQTTTTTTTTLSSSSPSTINSSTSDSSSSNTLVQDPYDACILVLRNGVNGLLGSDEGQTQMYNEQTTLPWDSQVKMYGRVVKKRARHNLCYDTVGQEPKYEEGKGRIIPFDHVPKLQECLKELREIGGEKFHNLKVEGNRYYDSEQCGIGYHGDTERVRVCGIRLGTVGTPIHYQWFKESKPVGDRLSIHLEPGEIYIMNEKAVGSDWKRRKIYTLRHAVGAKKYTVIKKK